MSFQALRDRCTKLLVQTRIRIRRLYRSYRPILPTSLPSSTIPSKSKPLSDRFLPPFFFLLALIPRLYKISYPPSVVFDEVHFLRFTSGYYHQEYFFDIHPPLGKLIFYLVTILFCGEPHLKYSTNGEAFGAQRYVPLRVTASLFGAGISPLCFLISRQFGLSTPAAVIPAFIQCFEHVMLIESRLVLIDTQLMFFMALCLFFATKLFSQNKERRWKYVVATAISGACALSVKWTALATPALVAIVSLIGYPFTTPLSLPEVTVAGVISIILYTFFFAVHFWLLPHAGRGDAFMLRSFRKTLVGDQFYQKAAKGPGFVKNFLYLNYEMFVANRGIKTRHHWESRWYQWVLNTRGLLYFNDVDEQVIHNRKIYLIVNPLANVLVLAAVIIFVACIVTWVWKRWRCGVEFARKWRTFMGRGLFLFCGYVFNLLPYLEVQRCTFLYHYLPALFYGLLLLAHLIDAIPSPRWRCITATCICTSVFIAFIIWSPWIYATPLTFETHNKLRLHATGWL